MSVSSPNDDQHAFQSVPEGDIAYDIVVNTTQNRVVGVFESSNTTGTVPLADGSEATVTPGDELPVTVIAGRASTPGSAFNDALNYIGAPGLGIIVGAGHAITGAYTAAEHLVTNPGQTFHPIDQLLRMPVSQLATNVDKAVVNFGQDLKTTYETQGLAAAEYEAAQPVGEVTANVGLAALGVPELNATRAIQAVSDFATASGLLERGAAIAADETGALAAAESADRAAVVAAKTGDEGALVAADSAGASTQQGAEASSGLAYRAEIAPVEAPRLAAAEGTVPYGFANAGQFNEFGPTLHGGLGQAGYADAQGILQGSAATGVSFRTGAAFDVGRVSDFDVALSGDSLFQAAQDAGIGLRSAGTRTGPLTEFNLRQLNLFDLSTQLSSQYGRPVNFMIYNSTDAAVERAPSVFIPKP